MKKILMALCVILSGCDPYIPEDRTRGIEPGRDGEGVEIGVDTTTRVYGYGFVVGKTGSPDGGPLRLGEIFKDSDNVELKALKENG